MPNPAISDPLYLSTLVASRLCHDLISPIGAIGNGIELMVMDSAGPSGAELALILDSTGAANARIRLFRLAFGLCSADQRVARSDVGAILDDITTGGRVSVVLDTAQDLARRDAKLVLLGYMCLDSCLPQGGVITVTQHDRGWRLSATAMKFRDEPVLWAGLSDPDLFDDVTPGQVHFPVLALEAARQHRRLTVNRRDDEIQLTF